ncbi:GatB/YqeY domain-containing protein [Desulfococcus sp.]|uniref:GatB/YqeY domain-containing protein n=1 Tax=Desulfococcus sp. TaxID=2025834 RepID=UPI003593AA08
MSLQEQIKKDLMTAMKAKDEPRKGTLRVVMGEFGRTDKKTLADEDVVKILKKLVKSEVETLDLAGGDVKESPFIRIIEDYLPRTASEEEVRDWISKNVDFSKYKARMQAMREIIGHFGGNVDGNMVRSILESL